MFEQTTTIFDLEAFASRINVFKKETIIELEFLGPSESAPVIPGGELEGLHFGLEYTQRRQFCAIRDLGPIPRLPMTTNIIVDGLDMHGTTITSAKVEDLLTCPCFLYTQRVYGMDLTALTKNDIVKTHDCETCMCQALRSPGAGVRYLEKGSGVLPRHKDSPVTYFNVEHKFGLEPIKRLIYDISSTPTGLMRLHVENPQDFLSKASTKK